MAQKYLSQIKEAIHAGIWEQLCPECLICTDDSKTLKNWCKSKINPCFVTYCIGHFSEECEVIFCDLEFFFRCYHREKNKFLSERITTKSLMVCPNHLHAANNFTTSKYHHQKNKTQRLHLVIIIFSTISES